MELEEIFHVHKIFNRTNSLLLTMRRECILREPHQEKDVGSHSEKKNLRQT
jgi:hypothetical protein